MLDEVVDESIRVADNAGVTIVHKGGDFPKKVKYTPPFYPDCCGFNKNLRIPSTTQDIEDVIKKARENGLSQNDLKDMGVEFTQTIISNDLLSTIYQCDLKCMKKALKDSSKKPSLIMCPKNVCPQ